MVVYTTSEQVNTVVSSDESEIHDESHIRGRRITASHIHALVEERGLDAQTADRFDLTASEVYHALAYYHDHPEEMRAVEERRRELHQTAEDDPDIITPRGPAGIIVMQVLFLLDENVAASLADKLNKPRH